MHVLTARRGVLIAVIVGVLLALIITLIAFEQTTDAAVLRDSGAACSREDCSGLGSPEDSPAAPRRAVSAAAPNPEQRQIIMRPPYSLNHRQVALTCGFHDSCKRRSGGNPTYARGAGLDWNDNNGTEPETRRVYFTASAHASRPGTRVATVKWEFHRAGRDRGYPCSTLVAKVYGYPKQVELFRVMYQHVVPVRGLRTTPVYSSSSAERGAESKPNVVVWVATMTNDPCAYFSRAASGQPLYHVHVEPQSQNPRVRFRTNVSMSRGVRVIPGANGCGQACDGPVYPGPRWSKPYWKLWTYSWAWRADTATGVPR